MVLIVAKLLGEPIFHFNPLRHVLSALVLMMAQHGTSKILQPMIV
jgi:hypothetical protein